MEVNHVTLEGLCFEMIDSYATNCGYYEIFRFKSITVKLDQNGGYTVSLNTKAVDVDGLEGLKKLLQSSN